MLVIPKGKIWDTHRRSSDILDVALRTGHKIGFIKTLGYLENSKFGLVNKNASKHDIWY